MVTPFLPSPMCPGEVPPMPGEDVKDPNNLEVLPAQSHRRTDRL